MATGLFLVAIQAGVAGDGNWRFSTIDRCAFAAEYDHSRISLGSDGHVQALFQRDWQRGCGLKIARYESGAWNTRDIEDGCSIFMTRFVIDVNGAPHVLYSAFNCKNKGLKYARLNGGQWQSSTIYSEPSLSKDEVERRFGNKDCSLALLVSDASDLTVDGDAGAHLVYADPETERVVYGYRSRDAKHWVWERLEKVGNHRVTVSRIMPVVRVSPAGEVWVVYKKYTPSKTFAGADQVRIELRLAVKTGREWKYRTIVDGLGFIDGQSEILFGKTNERLVAYTRCAAVRYSDPSMKWLLVQLSDGKWVKRYEGDPGEQLLTVAWVGDRFHMLMTRVRPDRPLDGGMPQDTLVRLSAGTDWKWKTETLLELKGRQALDAVMNRDGDAQVLFSSSSATSSTLNLGFLRRSEPGRHDGPAEGDQPIGSETNSTSASTTSPLR
jgi:hypothetical protein